MQQGEHHPFMERCSPYFLSNKIRQSTTKIRRYILHFRKIYVSLQGISFMATRRAIKKWNAENDTLPIYD